MRSWSLIAGLALTLLLGSASLRAEASYQVADLANPVSDNTSETQVANTSAAAVASPYSCTDAVGCNQCAACDQCCCNECVPPWRIQVGYINMSRSRPNGAVLIADPANVPLLNANQFDLGNQSGVDVDLRRTLNQDWDLDARYLWISDYGTSGTFAVPAGMSSIPTNPVTFFGGPSQADYRYQSAIQTAELNIRRNYGCWGMSGGFRYVELEEQFYTLYTVPGVLTQDTDWKTRNNLYGFQLGADAILWQSSRGLRIDSFVKAGIYGNAASSSFNVNTTGIPFIITSASDASHTAFLSELGFIGVYPLTEHLSLRAGYQMLWVSGVALASEQVAATGNLNTMGVVPSSIDTSGDLFYHGVNVGLEINW